MNQTSGLRSRPIVMLAIAATLVLCIRGGLAADEVLCLAPALALAAMLFARRYPGERLLSALAGHGEAQRPRPRAPLPSSRRAHARVPRGGLLMGFALAVRPPPALLAS